MQNHIRKIFLKKQRKSEILRVETRIIMTLQHIYDRLCFFILNTSFINNGIDSDSDDDDDDDDDHIKR